MKTPTPKKTPATTTSVTKIKKNIIRSPTKAKPVGTAYGGSIETWKLQLVTLSLVSCLKTMAFRGLTSSQSSMLGVPTTKLLLIGIWTVSSRVVMAEQTNQ